MTFKEHLETSRRHIDRSRAASERAKDFMDAGYPKRRERDGAVEGLRDSVEHLVEALVLLEAKVTALEQKPRIMRRRI